MDTCLFSLKKNANVWAANKEPSGPTMWTRSKKKRKYNVDLLTHWEMLIYQSESKASAAFTVRGKSTHSRHIVIGPFNPTFEGCNKRLFWLSISHWLFQQLSDSKCMIQFLILWPSWSRFILDVMMLDLNCHLTVLCPCHWMSNMKIIF